MEFNSDIHIFQNRVYDIFIYITWLLYFAIALGLSVNAPEYLDTLQSFMKLYVSLFLIYRFNPFRRVKFTRLDAKITFSAGLFLLGTTAIDRIIKTYISTFKEYIKLFKSNH
jgi:uncharacterized BrkB/YihY/UPF0761 family membrane protein